MNMQKHYNGRKFSHCLGVIKISVRSGNNLIRRKTKQIQDNLITEKADIQERVKKGEPLSEILKAIGRSMEDIPNYKGGKEYE